MQIDRCIRRQVCLASLVLGFMGLAGCGPQDAGVSQGEEGQLLLGQAARSITLQRGVALGTRTLMLDGFRGTVSLSGADVEGAALTFTKHARGRDAQDAADALGRITLEETGDEATYRYVMRAKDPQLSNVDVEGVVPRGSRVTIRLSSGTVALSGIDGPLEVKLENGNVSIGGAGESVTVETHNGAIDLGLYRLPAGGALHLRTTNGNLAVTLPGNVSAGVEAQTSAGTITMDGLSFADQRLNPDGAGAHFRGRLGQGGATITLRTENGAIALQEGSVLRLPPLPGEGAPEAPKADSSRTTPVDTLRAPVGIRLESRPVQQDTTKSR